ncbi:Sec-independent protein translocase subunit TatB [Rhodococcus sp. D2-41]|uniref:Sec-independent protein translocase protein TatB n=1 Tax=Speluncibacter jeojiensis TaxID=2710754 RepID=A0A9X4M1C5_9ACTN|nr:Sec-independent protein translocase protein TatB [Rhodococcus sp. D2-41]MDG3012512.1 Sec-independent protein translocase subunit TatB [Rhodococcus sp. D2-41]MDG3015371.1 Sec-independent protein translocase protein TatB [Corynebacteriales bacterium D3-21]
MFGNIGWGEFGILIIAALVILGPERLPGAMSWVSKSLRQVRDYAAGAQQQLKDELGPEFDDLRKPLADLQQLRGMSPQAMITKHLLDGDDSLFTGNFDGSAPSSSGPQPPSVTPAVTQAQPPREEPQLGIGERPPYDLDAT